MNQTNNTPQLSYRATALLNAINAYLEINVQEHVSNLIGRLEGKNMDVRIESIKLLENLMTVSFSFASVYLEIPLDTLNRLKSKLVEVQNCFNSNLTVPTKDRFMKDFPEFQFFVDSVITNRETEQGLVNPDPTV